MAVGASRTPDRIYGTIKNSPTTRSHNSFKGIIRTEAFRHDGAVSVGGFDYQPGAQVPKSSCHALAHTSNREGNPPSSAPDVQTRRNHV